MSDLMTRGVIMMPLELAMSSELSRMQFHSRAQEVLQERDTYRDLCAELIEKMREIKMIVSSPLVAYYIADDAITKAESILGESQ